MNKEKKVFKNLRASLNIYLTEKEVKETDIFHILNNLDDYEYTYQYNSIRKDFDINVYQPCIRSLESIKKLIDIIINK